MTTTESPKAHSFELAGLGTGPYKFLYAYSLPSPSLAEQNPSAYSLALREQPRDLVGGVGCCAHCGRGIRNIYVIQDAQGRKYGIGCDCVEKTGDPCIANPVKIEEARRQARARAAAAEEKRRARVEAYQSTPEYKAKIEREAQERAEHEVRKANVVAKWENIIALLRERAPRSGFCQSVHDQLLNGLEPEGKALAIVLEIYGKNFGRYGSKKYNEAVDALRAKLGLE